MDEKKPVEEEQTNEDSDDGVQPKEPSIVEQADSAAERLKTENDRKEKLLEREENIAARKALGGDRAGPQGDEKPKEESPEEYSKRIQQELKNGKLK